MQLGITVSHVEVPVCSSWLPVNASPGMQQVVAQIARSLRPMWDNLIEFLITRFEVVHSIWTGCYTHLGEWAKELGDLCTLVSFSAFQISKNYTHSHRQAHLSSWALLAIWKKKKVCPSAFSPFLISWACCIARICPFNEVEITTWFQK